jgi:hypothetical protein
MASNLHVFPLRQAYRFLPVEIPFAPAYDPVVGANPPYGASINYWARTAAKDSASITVSDAAGTLVKSFKGPAKVGVNRAWWNLTNELTKEAKLRTGPLHSPEIRYPPEGRAAPGIGRFAWLVPPGTYTVKVKVGADSASQTVVVRKDPNSGGSEEEIRASVALAGEVAADLNSAVDMINALEVVRSQILTVKASLGDDEKTKDVREQVDSLDRKLIAVEERLFQMRVTGRGQDLLRWPNKVAEQLLYLGGSITGSDFGPTAQHKEVHQVLKTELASIRAAFDAVMKQDVESFKTMLRGRNIQNIIISN